MAASTISSPRSIGPQYSYELLSKNRRTPYSIEEEVKSPKDSGPSSCWIISGVQVASWIGNTCGWLSRVERWNSGIFEPVPHKPSTAKWIRSSERERPFQQVDRVWVWVSERRTDHVLVQIGGQGHMPGHPSMAPGYFRALWASGHLSCFAAMSTTHVNTGIQQKRPVKAPY